MRVLVPIKQVIDPSVKVQLLADSLSVDKAVKMSINPFDEVALEEALRWRKQNLIAEVIIVSIGSVKALEILRRGLAFGADRAILWSTDVSWEPLNIAKVLQLTVEQESIDLVMMGKQAIDTDSNQTGQMLAAMLNWAQASFASKIEFVEDKTVQVRCEIESGLELLELKTPCIITADLNLNTPRYLSLPNIMKASSKPIDIREIPEALNLKTRTKRLNLQASQPRKQGMEVKNVEELIHYLKEVEHLL